MLPACAGEPPVLSVRKKRDKGGEKEKKKKKKRGKQERERERERRKKEESRSLTGRTSPEKSEEKELLSLN